MFNLEKQFAVVGVMEQFETSIAMMEAMLPRFGSLLHHSVVQTTKIRSFDSSFLDLSVLLGSQFLVNFVFLDIYMGIGCCAVWYGPVWFGLLCVMWRKWCCRFAWYEGVVNVYERRNLQIDASEAGSVGEDTSCQYHPPHPPYNQTSSSPLTIEQHEKGQGAVLKIFWTSQTQTAVSPLAFG